MLRTLLVCLSALASLVFDSAAQAAWLRAESPGFVVWSEGGGAALRERVLQLEEFDRLLRLLTGLRAPRSPGKLHVYIVSGSRQQQQIAPVEGASGFYAASTDGVLAVVDESGRQDYHTHQEILLHEYAHHFMLQYFPAEYPAWYVEGFAEYVATARFAADTVEIGRYNEGRASWLADRSAWLPLDAILFGRTDRLAGAQVVKFYAQSWLLTHYLMRDATRRGQLTRYLQSVIGGQDARAAFTAAFATTPSAMTRTISRYGGEDLSFTRLPRVSAAEAPPVTITPLPLGDELVLAGGAARLTRQGRAADAFLARVRGLTRGRDDAFSRRLLARVEAQYGDGAVADGLLQPLLAAAPADAELLYLQAMRHLVAGRRDAANRAAHFRTARTWFTRAFRADGDHVPTLYRSAESRATEPSFLEENNLNIMRLAYQNAPQVREIGYSLAIMLMRKGDFAEAERILTPLATPRHGSRLVATVTALVAKARARDATALPDPFAIPEEN